MIHWSVLVSEMPNRPHFDSLLSRYVTRSSQNFMWSPNSDQFVSLKTERLSDRHLKFMGEKSNPLVTLIAAFDRF